MGQVKVKELIEILKTVDPEAVVVTSSSNFELNHGLVDIRVSQFEGTQTPENFRDAFDGTPFTKLMYHRFPTSSENKIKIVEIVGV